jgi:ubiquinone/menaquinone biosynthesis C-methylase UbiE
LEESDPILNYYSKGVERDRLNQDPFLVEGIRTKELISRHLGPAPLKIADIGGGAGYYALWLAALGHQVYLIDPSPVNIGAAKEADANRKLTSIEVGDARKLRFQPDFFDVVLMMGPLYHLTERGERLNALSEGHRILKKGVRFSVRRSPALRQCLTDFSETW